jgi:hypothetical protein
MISFYHGPESDLDELQGRFLGQGIALPSVSLQISRDDRSIINNQETWLLLTSVLGLGNIISSGSSFNQAIEWLDDCIERHTGCHPNPAITPMTPSRLIDVILAGAGGRVRIVDTECIPTRYAALTYCWGQMAQD